MEFDHALRKFAQIDGLHSHIKGINDLSSTRNKQRSKFIFPWSGHVILYSLLCAVVLSFLLGLNNTLSNCVFVYETSIRQWSCIKRPLAKSTRVNALCTIMVIRWWRCINDSLDRVNVERETSNILPFYSYLIFFDDHLSDHLLHLTEDWSQTYKDIISKFSTIKSTVGHF
jgi:hypothetical protein